MSEIRATLNERGGRYGRFDKHARLADQLIRVAQFELAGGFGIGPSDERHGWLKLAADQRHSIRYILDKIARILEGDPDYTDNWHDIAGYATLIEDRLNGTGLYAPTNNVEFDNRVYASQCGLEAGRIIAQREYESARCQCCYALLGDVHAPDCRYYNLETARNPR